MARPNRTPVKAEEPKVEEKTFIETVKEKVEEIVEEVEAKVDEVVETITNAVKTEEQIIDDAIVHMAKPEVKAFVAERAGVMLDKYCPEEPAIRVSGPLGDGGKRYTKEELYALKGKYNKFNL